MLKWSQAVLLAFHAMAFLAARQGEVISVEEMARALGVSCDHLSKVMQRLVKTDLVRSVRGPSGGYSLSAAPETLSLLQIYERVEGKLCVSECMLHDSKCGGTSCIFGDMMVRISATVSDYLAKTMLSDVAPGSAASRRE